MVKLYNAFLFFLVFSIGVEGISYSQSISGISPSNANIGQTLTVSISGQNTNFGQGTSTTNVWFSQGSSTLIFPVNSSVINAGQVDATFIFPNTLSPGLYDVNVQNTIDGQMTVPTVFMLNPNPNPPVLVSASPTTGDIGQYLQVTITGQYTSFAQGTSTANVWFSQGTSTLIYPSNVTVVNDTKINADFYIPTNSPGGFYNVNTTDDLDGQLTLTNGFNVNTCVLGHSMSHTDCSCYQSNDGTATETTFSGTPPYTYLWSPSGQTAQTATGLGPGNYVVTVTDNIGCSDTVHVAIIDPPPIDMSTYYSWKDTCGDGSAMIAPSGGAGIFTYTWSPTGQTSQTATGLNAGDYTVTVTEGNGCTATQTISVAPFPLSVSVTGSTTFCTGQNTILTANSAALCSWVWNTGATTASITVSPTATTTYSVIATNKTCSDTASKAVTVYNSGLLLSMVQDTVNPLTWYLQPTINGTAPFTYLWDFGDGNLSTLSNPTHNYAVAGHYAICLTVTDANGCVNYSCDSTYKVASTYIQTLIVLNTLTGIQENEVSVNSVSPNPSNSSLTISLSQTIKGRLIITDITGREVYAEKINADNIQIDVSDLPIGYYTLSIFSEKSVLRERVMIAR